MSFRFYFYFILFILFGCVGCWHWVFRILNFNKTYYSYQSHITWGIFTVDFEFVCQRLTNFKKILGNINWHSLSLMFSPYFIWKLKNNKCTESKFSRCQSGSNINEKKNFGYIIIIIWSKQNITVEQDEIKPKDRWSTFTQNISTHFIASMERFYLLLFTWFVYFRASSIEHFPFVSMRRLTIVSIFIYTIRTRMHTCECRYANRICVDEHFNSIYSHY